MPRPRRPEGEDRPALPSPRGIWQARGNCVCNQAPACWGRRFGKSRPERKESGWRRPFEKISGCPAACPTGGTARAVPCRPLKKLRARTRLQYRCWRSARCRMPPPLWDRGGIQLRLYCRALSSCTLLLPACQASDPVLCPLGRLFLAQCLPGSARRPYSCAPSVHQCTPHSRTGAFHRCPHGLHGLGLSALPRVPSWEAKAPG